MNTPEAFLLTLFSALVAGRALSTILSGQNPLSTTPWDIPVVAQFLGSLVIFFWSVRKYTTMKCHRDDTP